jgi:hypothetical protein
MTRCRIAAVKCETRANQIVEGAAGKENAGRIREARLDRAVEVAAQFLELRDLMVIARIIRLFRCELTLRAALEFEPILVRHHPRGERPRSRPDWPILENFFELPITGRKPYSIYSIQARRCRALNH